MIENEMKFWIAYISFIIPLCQHQKVSLLIYRNIFNLIIIYIDRISTYTYKKIASQLRLMRYTLISKTS